MLGQTLVITVYLLTRVELLLQILGCLEYACGKYKFKETKRSPFSRNTL